MGDTEGEGERDSKLILRKGRKEARIANNEHSVKHNAAVVVRIKSRFPFHTSHKFQTTEGVGENEGRYLQAKDGGRRRLDEEWS